ncbi:MAG TPA: endo-1,4-beta-xylanase, partial [Polyangiaceae bacterium]|nr:endo-1,4-beta-xylanase [Polyangiaceae bacterium]
TALAPYVISANNATCDQRTPSVTLTANSKFFTVDGALTLTANATDNVAVRKVVFLQDGAVIGEDTTAPYSIEVPVTTGLNGRHRYTATAYDLSGNAGSNTTRVLVSINNKFFGGVATTAVDYPKLLDHFKQLTPGNAGKWGSVEATRDQMNWADLDTAYQFAKSNGIPFKLHTLVWGQQQPGWLTGLTVEEQLAEIEEWMAALAERYPDAALVDVVNEPLHAPPGYAAALGGAGTTGWDWVIKSFELARKYFPNSELLLNDYSVLSMASATTNYLNIVNLLNDRGLIDGIGEQGHFYERAELSVLSSNLNAFAATGLPVYITELDINFANDARHALRMSELFPLFWSNPSVLGVTHWGHLQGNMWQTDAYLLRTDGTPRPALTWLECYKAGGTDCPLPVYVPEARKGDSSGITLEAEDYDSAQGLLAAGSMVAYADSGDWLSYDKIAFNDNWDTLSVSYAQGGPNPVNITIHLDSLENAPVATVKLPPTGGWGTMQTATIPWLPLSGERKMFVRFGAGANVDKLKFSAPSGTGPNVIPNSDFEAAGNGGWSTWSSGTIATTATRAVSGAQSLAMTGRSATSPLAKTLTNLVVPGKTYKVNLWATVGGAASADAYVTTKVQCSGGNPDYQRLGGWSNVKMITDGAWVQISGDLVVPDCQLTDVSMWLEGPGANVDLYVDHVSVRAQSTTNIVSNGTFESGTSGWYTWGGATMSATTVRAHGGTKSLLVANRTGNSPAVIDLTSVVKPGISYPFSLWVSMDSSDGTSKSVNVTRALTVSGSTSWSWVGSPVTVADDGNWVQIAGTLAVPQTFSGLQIYVEGAAGADLYVDDVQFIDNSGTVVNLIPDGTFESGQGAWFDWTGVGLAVVDGYAHAGTHSLVSPNRTQNGVLARDVTTLVTAGKRYQATFWVSVNGIAAGSSSVNVTRAINCGSGAQYGWLQQVTVNNGEWQKITGPVDLSACTSVSQVSLFAEGPTSGNLYVDDVELIAL